ncbi:MAG: L-lactate permease [Cytophagales bacterium]
MVVFISLALLLLGVFVFKKVWLGCSLGILFLGLCQFLGWLDLNFFNIFFNTVIVFVELGLLIFGSIHFYKTLENLGHFEGFSEKLKGKYEPLMIVIMLCWFMCSFFEGVAGFGVPTLLIAPLLIALNFKPITAVVVTLCANTLSVTYGALGTPTKLGLGISDLQSPVLESVVYLLIFPILFMPFALTLIFDIIENKSIKAVLDQWKFLTLSGLVFLFFFIISSKLTLEFSSAAAGGLGFITLIMLTNGSKSRWSQLKKWLNFFYPYLFLVFLLVLIKPFLQAFSFDFGDSLKKFRFYQPGLILLLSALLWSLFKKQSTGKMNDFELFVITSKMVSKTFLNVFFLVFFAIMIQGSVIELFYESFSSTYRLLPLASLIGVLGSFVTGSLTMSNLIFVEAFKKIIINQNQQDLSIALLHIGGALGNAISLQNILLANSVLEKKQNIGKVVLINAGFVLIFLVILMIQQFLWA